jgi:hypothetical protein
MAQASEVFLFQPTSIPGCQLWLDAADVNGNGLSPVNDSSVSIWVDKSGNGRSVSQGTLLNQPTNLNIRGINYINFTSANTNFLSNTSMNIDYRTSQIFLVFQRKSVQSNNGVFCPLANANSGADWANTNEFIITTLTEVASAGSGTNDGQSGNLNLTTYQFVINNNSLTTFRDFGDTSVITRNMGLTTSPTALYIGRRRDGGSLLPANILFGEALVYNKLLSVNENQQIQGYLAWKWGLQGSLPSNHPFKTYRPLAATPIPTSIPPMPSIGQTNQVFVPTQISGCQLWLDATDVNGNNTSVSSGATVSSWIDKSGNRRNTSTAAGSITYATSSTSLVFNGSSYYTLPNNTFPTGNTAYSLVIVSSTNLANYYWIIGGGVTTGGQAVGCVYYPNGIIENGWWSTNIQTSAGIVTANQTNVIVCTYDTATLTTFFNGVSRASSSSLGTRNSPSGPNLIGARIDSSPSNVIQALVGNINEIIVYNSGLTTAQRQQVEGYLAWKWGLVSSLPNGHPYKVQQIAPFSFRTTPFRGSLNQWQPTQISGCRLWLDASDLSTVIQSGASVTQWNDKTATTNVSQANASLQPTYLATGFNGRPTLRFTAVQGSSYQVLQSASTSIYNSITSFTYFAVARLINPAPNNPGIVSLINKVSFYLNGLNNASGFSGTNIWTFQGSTFVASPNTSFPFDSNVLFCLSLGSTQQFFLNGSNSIASPSFSFGSGTNLVLNIGWSGYNASDGYNGMMSEVLLYTTPLTTVQRQQVEGYLAWKWGLVGSLPANHPFRLFPPSP